MSDAAEKQVLEMLCKLPVEQVLSFKGVSKSVIDSPDFIKMHLAHSIETHSNHSLILYGDYVPLHLADYDSFNQTNSAVFQELDYPLKIAKYPSRFFGSCNGLICLLNPYEVIVLWNPSTKKFKKLPVDLPNRKALEACSGFGYDSVNDDYKVVRILQFSHDVVNDKETKVYSLKSNSWKLLILDFPYFVSLGNGVLANGALHWVVRTNNASEIYPGKRVAAFDLGTEEFRLVSLPEFSHDKFYLGLGVLDECLCVLCNYMTDRHAEIWVRKKQHGVEYNWTNLISIRQNDLVATGGFLDLKPITYSKCGKRVLFEQDECKLLWYDLEKKSISYATVQTSSDDEFWKLDICVHSLVQPNSDNGDSGKAEKEEQNPKRKRKSDDFLSTGFNLKL